MIISDLNYLEVVPQDNTLIGGRYTSYIEYNGKITKVTSFSGGFIIHGDFKQWDPVHGFFVGNLVEKFDDLSSPTQSLAVDGDGDGDGGLISQ